MTGSHRPVHRELRVRPGSRGPEATWGTNPEKGHSILSLWDPTQGQRQLPEPGPPGTCGALQWKRLSLQLRVLGAALLPCGAQDGTWTGELKPERPAGSPSCSRRGCPARLGSAPLGAAQSSSFRELYTWKGHCFTKMKSVSQYPPRVMLLPPS